MPSFKLWFVSALVLSAILFPRSTVFADDVPDPPTASFTDETVRPWKDASGEFTTQAVLVGVQKDIVSLRKKDDRTIQVPLSKLSTADQAYVQSKLERTLSKPTPKPVLTDETVVKVPVPSAKWIAGSWKATPALDLKRIKAELAKNGRLPKQLPDVIRLIQLTEEKSICEFRADGTLTIRTDGSNVFEPEIFMLGIEGEVGWKLMDKGEKELELEWMYESGMKTACSFAWISKDEFTVEFPMRNPFFTGYHFHRIKEAKPIVFPRSTVIGSWKMTPTFHPLIDLMNPGSRKTIEEIMVSKLTASVEFRADGTYVSPATDTRDRGEANWKLGKGEKSLVFADTRVSRAIGQQPFRDERSLIWVSKDEFTLNLGASLVTGVSFHRKKEAPKP